MSLLSDKINFPSQKMPCYINYIWIGFLNYDFSVIWLIIFPRKILDVSFKFECFFFTVSLSMYVT